ncbi:MAG: DUF2202 domain-containing protein [Caldilineales bacterium]
MIKLTNTLLAGAFAFGLGIAGVAGTATASAAPADRGGPVRNQAVTAPGVAAGDLTPDEIDGLVFMREEEKVARDVYLTLGDLWGAQIFTNIARSEQSHMDAVYTLLDRYDIADPAAGSAIGEFTNPDLQALYDSLVALGSQSLQDALTVGALIEETDIADLIDELSAIEHADIQGVYENLENGSNNHLRAFTSTLERQTGVAYEPQVLDQQTYNGIVSASTNSAAAGQRGRMNRR